MREMKNSGVEWIGEIPVEWSVLPTKRFFRNVKRVAGKDADNYERLALTLNGVIKRSKTDNEGLQPEQFESYQILKENEMVFKLIDLENVKTSRVGLSSYTGLVSPAYIVLTNDNTDNRFYYYWFISMYYNEVFNRLGGAGVRSALNAKDLLNIPAPNLNESERKSIADFLDEKCAKIDAVIEKQKQVIEKLKEYKLSIITEAVTKGLDPTVPMKDSGVKWIGEIPCDAEVVSVSKIFKIVLGKMLSTKAVEDNETLEKYFCAANVHFDTIDYDNLKQMWFSDYEKNIYKVKKGDLLVVEGGAGAGGANVVSLDVEDCYIQNSIMIVRPLSYIRSKWLYYYLYSLVKRNYIDYVCNKATIPHFTKDKLSKTKIVVFSENETEIILKELDETVFKVDETITQKQSIIDKLTEYKKSLIYEVVTGKKEV